MPPFHFDEPVQPVTTALTPDTTYQVIDRFVGKYRFLSNFWPCHIVDDMGLEYGSVEAAYQASKSTDRQTRLQFVTLTPVQARRLGRRIRIRPDWDQIKPDVMRSFVRQKFNDPRLARLLVETRGHELIEGNTWGDTFWGICNGIGQKVVC